MQLPVEVQLQSGTFLQTVEAVLTLPSHFGHRVWVPVKRLVLRPSISSPCLSLIQVGTEPYYRLDFCLESPYELLGELQKGNHLPLRVVASCDAVSKQARERLECLMGGQCGSWLRLEGQVKEAVIEAMVGMESKYEGIVRSEPVEALPSAALPHLEKEEPEIGTGIHACSREFKLNFRGIGPPPGVIFGKSSPACKLPSERGPKLMI